MFALYTADGWEMGLREHLETCLKHKIIIRHKNDTIMSGNHFNLKLVCIKKCFAVLGT